MLLSHIANISGKVRERTLDGRDYWVVPITMLAERVLDGNAGPIFYPHKQNSRFATAWNSKPVVVYHPEDDMESAATPSYIESNTVGFLLENHMSGRQQKAEGWIDQKKADKVDYRIRRSIENGMNMEVSTGLDADVVKRKGKHNGQRYQYIARNYRPDHLALLPDQIGACSLADGCGMMVANKAVPFKKMKRIQKFLNAEITGKEKPMRNCGCQQKGKTSMKTKNKRRKVTSNARKTISKLIEDNSTVWTEKDRKKLEGMDESLLDKLMQTPKSKVSNSSKRRERLKKLRNQMREQEDRKERRRAKRERVSNKSTSVKSYLRDAPPEIRSAIRNAMAVQREQRKKLFKVILANKRNVFTRDELKDMDDLVLNKLAAVAAVRNKARRREDDDEAPRARSAFSYFGQQSVANRRVKNRSVKPLGLPESTHVERKN